MFRIKKRVGKYEYVIEKNQAWIVRLLGICGVLSTTLLAWGYFQFVRNEPLLWVLSPTFVIIALYFMANGVLQCFYPGFDSKRHAKLVKEYWEDRRDGGPTVAVFIPAAGEAIQTVARTACAARDMRYRNKYVYILDDTPAGIYRETAERYGVGHVHRPNTGQGKKSGNLNYALKHTPWTAHVLVLDADFVPRAEMLREMIPYTADDVGILQTPQHFVTSKEVYEHSKIAYGAGYVQREFYRVIQVARNRFHSAICVGTNALYNRRALDAVGGYAEVDHSEDVNTGLKMLNYVRDTSEPYRIRYLPVQLATGECPDTYYGFYKQQNRWSTGSFRLVFSKKTLFSRTLRPTQKIIYFSNCLYYLYTVCILLMPLQLLALALSAHGSYQWQEAYYFVPQIIMRLVIVPHVLYQERKRLATMIVTTATAYTFMQALFLLIIRRPLGWEATGAASRPRNNRFLELKLFVGAYYVLLYVGTLAVAILNEAFGRRTSLLLQGLFLFALVAQTVHIGYLYMFGMGERYAPVPRAAKGAVATVAAMAVFILTSAVLVHPAYNLYATGNGQTGFVQERELHITLSPDVAFNTLQKAALRASRVFQ